MDKLNHLLKIYSNGHVIEYLTKVRHTLRPFIGDKRYSKLDSAIRHRTSRFTIVLENVGNPGNISAITRSCDAMGIHNIHLIENRSFLQDFTASQALTNDNVNSRAINSLTRQQHYIDQQQQQQIQDNNSSSDSPLYKGGYAVSMGSEKWVNVVKHTNVSSCVDHLKEKGYSIWTSDLTERAFQFDKLVFQSNNYNQLPNQFKSIFNSINNNDANLSESIYNKYLIESNSINSNSNSSNDDYIVREQEKIALVFGNEVVGVSNELKEKSDQTFFLPMSGMVQSFNVSVSVAMTLAYLKAQGALNGNLSEFEKNLIFTKWHIDSLGDSDLILKRYNIDPDQVQDYLKLIN
ncbi:hypothetical protein CYY_004394 [Polysphondylium violaceum]|uniref:tRNA/rRNA methyltransferase SpoU type domain-containing protein n=1 Tax=Polysphondylium violaceum TaxID=133409 RepID=A0A8J4PWA5_9MYCE|nr:hypothetical protein CYY_004394 [Polysphondylium violaceum]